MVNLDIIFAFIIRALVLCPYYCSCGQGKMESFIIGLQERLELFEFCNIRITSVFNTTEFEPFIIPVALIDVNIRKNKLFSMPTFHFKFRSLLCSLDLFHLAQSPYEKRIYRRSQYYHLTEYMEDIYFIVIRQHSRFLAEEHHKMWDSSVLTGIRMFIWTVKSDSEHVNNLRFHQTYFICGVCDLYLNSNCTVYVSQVESKTPEQ